MFVCLHQQALNRHLVCTLNRYPFNLLTASRGNSARLCNKHIAAPSCEFVLQCNLHHRAASKLLNVALKEVDGIKGSNWLAP